MRISETNLIAGARVARPIGKITAVSPWHAAGRPDDRCREHMLRDLVRRAEDIDADAIIAVAYRIEPILREGGVALERTCVEGIAVRVALAA